MTMPMATARAAAPFWLVNPKNQTVAVDQTPMDVCSDDARYGGSDVKGIGDQVEVAVDGQVLGRLFVSDLLA